MGAAIVLYGGLARDRPYSPTGRLATEADCVDATLFLRDNQGVTGVNLEVDGGARML